MYILTTQNTFLNTLPTPFQMFLSLVCYSGSKLRPEHNDNPTQVQMRCVGKLNIHILRERESEYPDVLVWCTYISSCWHDSRWGVWPPPDGRFTHKRTHAICLFCCHTCALHTWYFIPSDMHRERERDQLILLFNNEILMKLLFHCAVKCFKTQKLSFLQK